METHGDVGANSVSVEQTRGRVCWWEMIQGVVAVEERRKILAVLIMTNFPLILDECVQRWSDGGKLHRKQFVAVKQQNVATPKHPTIISTSFR